MKKIVIVTTRSYSGGNIVLRLLGKELQKRCFSVKCYSCDSVDLSHSNDFFKLFRIRFWAFTKDCLKKILIALKFREKKFEDLMAIPQQILPFVSKNTIVVYPEIVYGNPLRAKKVVRWFLYHNRFPNNPEAYGKDELIFSYREHFNDYNLNPSCRLLNLSHFNKELYKQTNFGERNGVCYIIRKGKNRTDLPQTFDGPIIDDLPEKEKVAIFNKCKFCYDYDTQTFYSTIAAVCGCVPIVVMELGKSKLDYLGDGDHDYGRAFGDTPEEIERAIKTRQQCLQMLDFEESNRKNVDFFIKTVSEYFAEK